MQKTATITKPREAPRDTSNILKRNTVFISQSFHTKRRL